MKIVANNALHSLRHVQLVEVTIFCEREFNRNAQKVIVATFPEIYSEYRSPGFVI